MNISFENTEIAFKYKTDKELKRAKFLFASMAINWLVKLGTRITPWIIKSGLPVKGVIRKTIFNQFVGGETLSETSKVADKLSLFNVQVILDYGVEGKEGEENLYWQNCPMAFGQDKEGNWLSNTKEIINPYLGKNDPQYKSSMLNCGEIKDTIK